MCANDLYSHLNESFRDLFFWQTVIALRIIKKLTEHCGGNNTLLFGRERNFRYPTEQNNTESMIVEHDAIESTRSFVRKQ